MRPLKLRGSGRSWRQGSGARGRGQKGGYSRAGHTSLPPTRTPSP